MRAAASSRPFPVEPITVAARTAPVSERSTRIFASVPAPWASSSLGASGSTTLVARASTFGAEHAAAGGAGRGSAVWAGSAGARSAPGPFGEPKPVRLPLPSPLTSIGAPLATAIVRGARTRFGRADRAGGGAAGNGGTTSAGVRCRHARSRILANHERRLARIRFARSREVRQERKRNVNGDRRYKRDRDSPPRSPDAAHLSSNASKASVVTGRRLPPRLARES